ncbi:MAG: hypothetical protein ISS26_05870 [Candidatus Omnitrophica bacterium]|nr:hypothetical protein [Candidatus Omnitrophota bacterium]
MAKILGIIWTILGLLWLFKPEILKNRLKRKVGRRMKWIVYGFLIVFGFLIVASVLKAPGLPAKLAGMIGAVIAVKGMLLLFSKTSDRLWQWWADMPLIYFRLQALIVLAIGIFLFSF